MVLLLFLFYNEETKDQWSWQPNTVWVPVLILPLTDVWLSLVGYLISHNHKSLYKLGTITYLPHSVNGRIMWDTGSKHICHEICFSFLGVLQSTRKNLGCGIRWYGQKPALHLLVMWHWAICHLSISSPIKYTEKKYLYLPEILKE